MAKNKIDLKSVVARKLQGKMDKLAVKMYYSETLEGEIEIRKIPLQQYMDLISSIDDENSIEGMNQLIYTCCPMFKENASEAMEAYGVSEPTELPSVILEDQLNELSDIVEIINGFYGIEKIRTEIKN